MAEALDTAAEFRFIRTVSVYGTAILPLLEKLEWSKDAKWKNQLMADVRARSSSVA